MNTAIRREGFQQRARPEPLVRDSERQPHWAPPRLSIQTLCLARVRADCVRWGDAGGFQRIRPHLPRCFIAFTEGSEEEQRSLSVHYSAPFSHSQRSILPKGLSSELGEFQGNIRVF